VSGLCSTPEAPPDGGLAPVGAHRRLAWIAKRGAGAEVRFHDAAAGTTETLTAALRADELAFEVGTGAVMAVMRDAAGESRAYLVNTFRSGTRRGYAVDVILSGKDELSSPAGVAGESWFLKKVGDGEWKVVAAK
jgi:hypothetical protein